MGGKPPRKIIGEAKHVQNNPPELVPKEDRVARHVLNVLLPLSTSSGDRPLIVNHVNYIPGRGNIIVEYPGTMPGKILSFTGCHMDVVTANPQDWEFDPFSLSIDGDKLHGRGTTDCLGHVALVTELMRRLAETKPKLKSTVVAVFIANEENSSLLGIGVDELVKDGLLNQLKEGPLCSAKERGRSTTSTITSSSHCPCLNETDGVTERQLGSFTKRLEDKVVKPIPGSGSDLLRCPRPLARNSSPTVAAHHFLPMSSVLAQVSYALLLGF